MLQVLKVRPGRDLNPGLPRESLNIWKLAHAGGPGSNPWPGRTLRTVNFEALEVTATYFTFLETSSHFLFGQEMSEAQLHFQSLICYHQYTQVYFIKRETFVIRSPSLYITNFFLARSFFVFRRNSIFQFLLYFWIQVQFWVENLTSPHQIEQNSNSKIDLDI